MGPVTSEIYARLNTAFTPSMLEVENQSEQHRGHAGYTDGESHFHVTIKAEKLDGLTRVAQQRAVMAEVKDMMPTPIHAFGITVK